MIMTARISGTPVFPSTLHTCGKITQEPSISPKPMAVPIGSAKKMENPEIHTLERLSSTNAIKRPDANPVKIILNK